MIAAAVGQRRRFFVDRRPRSQDGAQESVSWRFGACVDVAMEDLFILHVYGPKTCCRANVATAPSPNGLFVFVGAIDDGNIDADTESASCCASIDFQIDAAAVRPASVPKLGNIVSNIFCSKTPPSAR